MFVGEFKCPNCCAKEFKRINSGKYQCVYCGSQWAEEDIIEKSDKDRLLELKKYKIEKRNEFKREIVNCALLFSKTDAGKALIASVGGVLAIALLCKILVG